MGPHVIVFVLLVLADEKIHIIMTKRCHEFNTFYVLLISPVSKFKNM